MMVSTRSTKRASDEGMTLVELLVYMVLLLVVMGMATALFIDVLRTQSSITTMAQENNEAQVLFNQLEHDVRNAAWVDVRYGGDLVVMRVRVASDADMGDQRCVAYYFNDATSTLHMTRSDSSTDTAAAMAAGAQSTVVALAQDWPLSHSELERATGNRVFGNADGLLANPESLSMTIIANPDGDKKRLVFDKAVQLRPQGLVGGCA